MFELFPIVVLASQVAQPLRSSPQTEMMCTVTAMAILVTMTLALIRAMLGPTVFDRVLALNMFGTKTVLLICVVDFLLNRDDFLDLALLYSLMNFIGMVALLRFTEYGSFGGDRIR